MKTGDQEPGSSGTTARKLVFWEFPRGSWQYDLVVALILLFIFATPREWFGDQPRAAKIVLISEARGAQELFLEADLLSGVPQDRQAEKAAELIRKRTGKRLRVLRVDPIRDETEQELKGFIAYTAAQK